MAHRIVKAIDAQVYRLARVIVRFITRNEEDQIEAEYQENRARLLQLFRMQGDGGESRQ